MAPKNSFSKPEFLSLCTIDMLSRIILCCGDDPLHCKLFRSIPGDFPGGLAAKTPHSQYRGLGIIPGQGTRPHMPQLRVRMPQLRPNTTKYLKKRSSIPGQLIRNQLWQPKLPLNTATSDWKTPHYQASKCGPQTSSINISGNLLKCIKFQSHSRHTESELPREEPSHGSDTG